MLSLKTPALWFNRYIWQFNTGKAGTFTVFLALALDVYSRGETLLHWVRVMIAPAAALIAQSGWSHLALVVGGLALIYRSTIKGKDHPIPKTTEERLDEMDSRTGTLVTTDVLATALGLQSQFNSSLGEVHDVFSGRIGRLEEDRTKAITQRAEINMRITAHDQRLTLADDAFIALPRFVADWYDFTELLKQIEVAIVTFAQLRKMYGHDNPIFAKPFSGWRPTNRTLDKTEPVDILEAEKWARALERHVSCVNAFYLSRHLPLPPVSDGHVFTLINTWLVNRNETTGDDFLGLLQKHYKELEVLRHDYAATLAAGALANATIS